MPKNTITKPKPKPKPTLGLVIRYFSTMDNGTF